MRIVRNLEDVQIVLKEILDKLEKGELKAGDRRGLQIKNMGDGTEDQDAVTLKQVKALIAEATK